jgi:hypothetical protein
MTQSNYKLNAVPFKIAVIFFIEIESKNNPKIHMEPQKALNGKSKLEQNEQRERHYI